MKQKHVFISYVHENEKEVQRLYDKLIQYGVKIWLDRHDIEPGVRWKNAIRRAIQGGAFFIACFSKEYSEREQTFMNEELTIAIEELRRRPTDRAWFIPVKLNECEIPDRDIGGGETLRDLQYVELYKDWDGKIKRILEVVQPNFNTSIDRATSTLNSIVEVANERLDSQAQLIQQLKGENQILRVQLNNQQSQIYTDQQLPIEVQEAFVATSATALQVLDDFPVPEVDRNSLSNNLWDATRGLNLTKELTYTMDTIIAVKCERCGRNFIPEVKGGTCKECRRQVCDDCIARKTPIFASASVSIPAETHNIICNDCAGSTQLPR